MMDLKTASPQEIAKYFSREVNNMFFKPDKIAEEQNGSRQMEDLDSLRRFPLSRRRWNLSAMGRWKKWQRRWQ